VRWRRHIRPILGTIALLAALTTAQTPTPATTETEGPQAQAPPRQEPPRQNPQKTPAGPLSPEWAVTVADISSSAPGVDAAAVYIPLRTPGLAALALRDGKVKWSVPTADIVAPPATGEGLVFLAHHQQVVALAAPDGSMRWRAEIEGTISAPFLCQSGWLLVVTDAGRVTMLRAATGERLWTQSLTAAVRVQPVAAGRHVYVATEDGRVAALALESGKVLWDAKLPAGATTLHPLDDRIFVGSRDRFFYCLAADSGKKKWRWRTGGTIVGVSAVDADRVYFVSLDNVLRALNRSGGDQVWKTSLPHRPNGGPFLFGHLLLVPGISSEVPAFRTTDGKPAGTVKLPGELSAPATLLPAAGDRPARLLVVSGEGLVQLLAPEPAARPQARQPTQ
jgi:hypothetical protein